VLPDEQHEGSALMGEGASYSKETPKNVVEGERDLCQFLLLSFD